MEFGHRLTQWNVQRSFAEPLVNWLVGILPIWSLNPGLLQSSPQVNFKDISIKIQFFTVEWTAPWRTCRRRWRTTSVAVRRSCGRIKTRIAAAAHVTSSLASNNPIAAPLVAAKVSVLKQFISNWSSFFNFSPSTRCLLYWKWRGYWEHWASTTRRYKLTIKIYFRPKS